MPHKIALAPNLIKLALSPDERWLIAGCDDGTGQYVLQRWDLDAALPANSTAKIGHHGGIIDEILIPAGRETVVTASWDRTVRRWPLLASPATNEGALLGELTGDVYCLTAAGDGVAFAGDGGVAGEDAPAAATPSQYRRHRIVLAALDGEHCLEFPEGHEEQIEVLQSSPAGKRLASGSVDGLIHVWNLAGQVPHGPMVLAGGHSSKVNAISFDPSGRTLLSGGDEGAIVLWDVGSAPSLARIGQHDAPVTQVIIPPDGSAVFSSSEDGSVRRWDLPQCQLIERACRPLKIKPQPYVESRERVDA
jgi:WD40 repeat protein